MYGDMTHVNNIKNSVNALLTNSEREPYRDLLNAHFGKNEIVSGIKRLKTGKAVALDIIKATADIITPLLVLLFNDILRNESFRGAWHIGLIVPLFKSGEDDDPSNYRGITITGLSPLIAFCLNC